MTAEGCEGVSGGEGVLAARVLDALVREDYAGLRGFVDRDRRLLRLAGRPVRLLDARPGFLADLIVDPGQGLRLDEVFAAVRALADPRDDVAAFERECESALATLRLHEQERPAVLRRLGRVPEELRRGPGPFYETLAAFTDHPVHPTGRSRAGLSRADLNRYAPEFGPVFPLRWATVPRCEATLAGVRPDWWPDGPDGRTMFPVHPLTAPFLKELPGVTVDAEPFLQVVPTLSMRTVVAGPFTHLKMPLPTSTLGLRNRRTIVPGTLPDGALTERILRRVVAHEPDLPLLLADEQTYGHAGSPLLGYLVRRFPEQTARAHVVPVAALLAEAPEGGCVIERWDVPSLFGAYLDALLTLNVALFRYGIALEAHQQNVSLVLSGGTDGDGAGGLLRLLVKDYDGTLIDPVRLRERLGPGDGDRDGDRDGADPGGLIDRRMTTRDPEALARVFVTITLHLCAAAPAFGLAERGLLPLRTGLAMVRDRLDAALGPQDAFLRARTLDAARLPGKAMVTAGTLVDKARTGAADINKHYGPLGPNYLRDGTCC
ncbi:IucA/IucC family protein [Spirillospora sp. NBC_01491]|uniref:IucA/IucC family protein n=1 Tax=Spirillospora sp. NBC_01491 TaxID=2976007 RepID=UPI002E318AEB|nr:IucA/IucC family protein [Spirillospora sp. NBC_01491]